MKTSDYESRRPLNVICRNSALDMILETDFIRDELLGGVNRPVRILPFREAAQVQFMNDALFLVLNEDLAGTVLDAVQRGCQNIGVLHMGDEFYQANRSYYPSVDYVLRNYYRDDLFRVPVGGRCQRIAWVPNGYRSGVGPRNPNTLIPNSHREHLLFFAGCPTTGGPGLKERRQMLDVIQTKSLRALVLTTKGFGQGLNACAYAALMENASFALVPGGRCAETIRLYDALEMGTIPITLKHNFLNNGGAMPDAPFEFLDSWEELPEWVNANAGLVHNARHAEKQQKCIAWWSGFKDTYRKKVAEVVESSFAAYPTRSR